MDEKEVANEFNQFFTSVGQNTVNKIKSLADECNYDLTQSSFVPRNFPPLEQFSFRPVTQDEIEQIILSMPTRKAPGIDKISIRVIKDCLSIILPSLMSLVNKSFLDDVFPIVWKKAEVTPILKDGDHEEANNNRPISLLPALSKICEKAASNQFASYLLFNERLTTKQSGNRKWHSTETTLIHTTDIILSGIDKKKTTAVALLDMGKAFDSVNHDILLNKLLDVGVSD